MSITEPFNCSPLYHESVILAKAITKFACRMSTEIFGNLLSSRTIKEFDLLSFQDKLGSKPWTQTIRRSIENRHEKYQKVRGDNIAFMIRKADLYGQLSRSMA